MTVTVTPNTQSAADRLRGIGVSIRSALSPVFDSNTAKSEAQEAFQDANSADNNTREGTILTLAKLAAAEAWTKADIDAGVRFALDSGNAKLPKSVETYAGQAKVAMHPKARDHVSHLFQVGNAAWEIEVEIVKATKDKSQALLARTFSRKFHMLMQMCGAAAEGVVIGSIEQLTQFAEAKDPQFDAKRQAASVLATIETLTAIYANFPLDDIKAAIDVLSDVNAERLKEIRAFALTPAAPPADTTTVVVEDESNEITGEAPATDDATTTVEAGNDVFSDIEDLLSDNLLAA